MTNWRNLHYLSDLCPGDYVVCEAGMLWNVAGQNPQISEMFNAKGLEGLILENNGEDFFIFSGGQIIHVIDHYNEPTRWVHMEELA